MDSLLEDRVLHKETWVAKLLGTKLSIQFHKKVKKSIKRSDLVHKTLELVGFQAHLDGNKRSRRLLRVVRFSNKTPIEGTVFDHWS